MRACPARLLRVLHSIASIPFPLKGTDSSSYVHESVWLSGRPVSRMDKVLQWLRDWHLYERMNRWSDRRMGLPSLWKVLFPGHQSFRSSVGLYSSQCLLFIITIFVKCLLNLWEHKISSDMSRHYLHSPQFVLESFSLDHFLSDLNVSRNSKSLLYANRSFHVGMWGSGTTYNRYIVRKRMARVEWSGVV